MNLCGTNYLANYYLSFVFIMCICAFLVAQHYNNHKGVIYIVIDTEIKVFHLKISIFSYYKLLKKGTSLNIKCHYLF